MKDTRVHHHFSYLILLAAALLLSAACDSGDLGWDGSGNGDGTSDTAGDPADDSGDVPVTTDAADTAPPDFTPGPKGSVEGIVMSPESGNPMVFNFPVSGALIYMTKEEPTPIPEGAYCHICVTLDETVPQTFSAANGSFRIDNIPQGSWIMVVRKGEFMKISLIDVVGDTVTAVDPLNTTFPRYHAPPNDYTPKMAVALGSYDVMEDIVTKMGLCPMTAEYKWDETPCDHIDMFDNGGGGFGSDFTPFANLLRSFEWMMEYHVIFVPCSGSSTDSALRDPVVLDNIRRYVEEGGKWYIADWSYDFVEQAFADFLDFEGNDTSIGAADTASNSFDSLGRAADPDLRDWLMAIGDPADSINFEENWDCILTLGNVPGVDGDGNPITITPYTWAEGPVDSFRDCMSGNAPLTLTFPYGCGKVLYTSYHTVGEMGGTGRPNLLTQEKILFYLILEIGLCTDEVIII
ncbi:MAG: hypothetical protein ABIJ56_03905 [Pseudomonadota bacterium]